MQPLSLESLMVTASDALVHTFRVPGCLITMPMHYMHTTAMCMTIRITIMHNNMQHAAQ